MKTIAIIGAGAAGLMTAATILESLDPLCKDFESALLAASYAEGGAGKAGDLASGQNPQSLRDSSFAKELIQIHIFEKNKTPGNKVIISGGGRCNVTTSITDKKILATKYTRGWDFIRKAMGKFGPQKVYDWFESHGVPLKVQEDLRVFPVSDDGYDIVDVFERIFAKHRGTVTLHYSEGVSDVSIFGKETEAQKYQITTPKGSYTTDVVVVTTGGSAYSHTGSTGDGYAFARALGHTITPLGPSLSSFLTREKWTHELSGLSFEDARITYSSPPEKGESEGVTQKGIHNNVTHPNLPFSGKEGNLKGPILLTHFGISGPLSFMFSSQIAWESLGSNNPKIIHLAPVADMGILEWDNFLKGEFVNHPKKLITSILAEKLPRRFVDEFIGEYFGTIREVFAASISKKDREHIAELLGKGVPITLIERRPGDEFVTAGGVSTDEIDPETMESKISQNLYFAGEVLNVDGYTGGFSLQICWSSGYVAGRDIASRI